MWSIPDWRRSVVTGMLLCGAAATAGCGFRPLYEKAGNSDVAALSSVKIDQIADRTGQQLRNLLIDRLSPRGPSGRTEYTLAIKLTESKRDLAIRKDETATRANLVIRANFRLTADRTPGGGIFTGVATSTNSYNVLRSDFATLSAEKDARSRALRAIADEIRLRVAAALSDPRAFEPTRQRTPE